MGADATAAPVRRNTLGGAPVSSLTISESPATVNVAVSVCVTPTLGRVTVSINWLPSIRYWPSTASAWARSNLPSASNRNVWTTPFGSGASARHAPTSDCGEVWAPMELLEINARVVIPISDRVFIGDITVWLCGWWSLSFVREMLEKDDLTGSGETKPVNVPGTVRA